MSIDSYVLKQTPLASDILNFLSSKVSKAIFVHCGVHFGVNFKDTFKVKCEVYMECVVERTKLLDNNLAT